MATYEVNDNGVIYEISSETDLSPDQLRNHWMRLKELESQPAQQAPQPSAPAPQTGMAGPTALSNPIEENYTDIVMRRVKDAYEAGYNTPKSALNIITGNTPGGRLPAALNTVRGVFSPIEAAFSPLTAGVEKGALTFGADPEQAKMIGDVAEIPFQLLTGIGASKGLFGPGGAKLVRMLGMGRGNDFVGAMQHDPHLRYAAARAPSKAANPLEDLHRSPDSSIEDLALLARSPDLAQVNQGQKVINQDVWLARVKNGDFTQPPPPPPVFTYKDYIEFGPKTTQDVGLFADLGTPSTVSARLNPYAAAANYEMQLTQIALNDAKRVHAKQLVEGLSGYGDDAIRGAVAYRRLALDNAHKSGIVKANYDKLAPDVKKVVDWLGDKFTVMNSILIPRMRNVIKNKIESRVRLEMTENARDYGVVPDGKAVRDEVERRVKEKIPDNWTIEEHIGDLIPGEFTIKTKDGRFVNKANSALEADMLINEVAKTYPELKAADMIVEKKLFMDDDLIRGLGNNRVRRTIENLAGGEGFSAERIQAAMEGKFLSDKGKINFFKPLVEGKGQGSGYFKDFAKVMEIVDGQIERMIQMTDLHERIAPMIHATHAKGQKALAAATYDAYQSLWGRQSSLSLAVDNSLAYLPVVNKLVAPHFLDRVVSQTKSGIVATFLTLRPSYHALNSTQIAQTLWPIADTIDVYRGLKLYKSKEGTELLKRHGLGGIQSKIEDVHPNAIAKMYDKIGGAGETFNQHAAFLVMYDKARRLGLSDEAAAAYGKLRGNVYSQFLGVGVDKPMLFRRADPHGIMTMFQRFPVKQAEMVIDLVKDKNFPGVAKWLAVNLTLGGMRGATLGNAGWLTYETYMKVAANFGEGVANLVHSGLPGLLGVDMANSTMALNPPYGNNPAEKIGNLVLGVFGSVAGSVLGAWLDTSGPDPDSKTRAFNGLVEAVPAFRELKTIIKLTQGDYDLKDPMGRLRYQADAVDLVKRSMGFKPVNESLAQSWAQAMMEMTEKRNAVLDYAGATYGQAQLIGVALGPDMEAAVWKEIDNWNAMWPEYPIGAKDINSAAKRRMTAGMENLKQRIMKRQPKSIQRNPMFKDFQLERGGG